ncbi:MAG: hypothetical protein JW917_08225 [Ignavibacteria bacterium]|nr:hypothetical protein [Ignavibacteria bacterium]
MKKIFTATLLFSFVLFLGVFLTGCVNYEQKTELSKDGSGEMEIHYWTGMSNVKSSTKVGDFNFKEEDVKSDYTSSNTEVKDVKVEEDLQDSTKHVKVKLTFKDINKLTDAKGFKKVTVSWAEGDDGMDFKYLVPKDTSAAKNMGASDNKLNYEFKFPGEILKTNGRKDGETVKWDNTLADLKEDIEMTATIKSEKKCGLFGLELPLVLGLGLTIFITSRKFRK